MTFLNRRLFDNVSVFVDSLSGANRVAFDVNKPNGILTLAISGNIVGDNVKVGTGSPEGSVVGKVGDVYQRKDGSTNTTLYIKESGSGNTGWTALGAPVSGGGSLSGGIQGRAAIWGTSSSISASHIISEGVNDLTIRGTTIVTTAKADGSIWNSIIIRDGMLGNVNDSGDHPGSRILYESSEGANPYRTSIEFGSEQLGMDSKSRMTLSTQNAYYDDLVPGITIVGGTINDGGGIYIKSAEPVPNNSGETVQISGSLLTTEEVTARDGIIVSSSSSPTVQLKTSNADHTVENFISEFGFSNSTIGGFMPTSGARIITYGNTPLTIKTKFVENPAGNSAIFNTTGNLLLKTNVDNNVDTLQVSGGAAISGALVSFNIRRGTGSPEGVVNATLGTIYQRTDGGTSTSVYIKETNTGTTGWTAIAPGSSGSGGTSLTGGISGRAAIWSGTTNISASSTIIESSGRVLIGGSDNGSDKLQVTGSAGISGWMVSTNIKRGVGSPEGFVTGNIGDMYQRTDGVVGGTIYMKETGSGNTGWIGIQSTTGAITASSIGASGLLSIYSRIFSLVDYYTKNVSAAPTTLSGTYTLGTKFVPTRNITIQGVRGYTAQTTGSMTAKLWRTGTTTALASAVNTIATSGYYEIRFPTPYIISNTDINYEFYATTLSSGNLYTRTTAAGTRVGSDPVDLYQEPGVILRTNAMSWWVTNDGIPNATSATERYPVEPLIDMTLATFSGLTTGSPLTGALLISQVAFGAGNNSISGSNTLTFSLTGGFSSNRSGALRSESIGLSAGNLTMTGADNTFVGWRSGWLTTTATRSTALGTMSLSSITDNSDNDNTAIGYRALASCSQQQNTAVGSQAGELIVSGSQNTVVGYNALSSNTGSSNNTAIGRGALSGTTGGNNTALGNDAGSGIVGGTGNTVLGYLAGQSISSGTNNTSVGSSSNIGSTLSSNVAIGAGATVLGAGSNGSIAIGTDADVNSGSAIGIGREVSIPTTNANTFVAGSSTYPINTVYFGKGISNATPSAYAIAGTRGSGTNIGGGSLQIVAGLGTGNATSGLIAFRTAGPGTAGSTVNNAVDRWSIFADGRTNWYGIATSSSPSAGISGSGAMYFNSTENKFKVIEGAGSWVDLVSSGSSSLSGGVAGKVAIWSGTSSISASSLITEATSSVVVDATIVADGINLNNGKLTNYTAEVIEITGTSLTIDTNDHSGRILKFTSSTTVTVTVPNTLPEGFNCLAVQQGTGPVTFSGTTNRQSHTFLAGQYAAATLVCAENPGGSSALVILAGDTSA